MGGSCGWIMVRRLNTLSTDVVEYMKKRNAQAWQKQMHIVEHLGTKEENPYNCAHEEKCKKKEGCFLESSF